MASMTIRISTEEEAGTITLEAKEAGFQASIQTPTLPHLILQNNSSHNLLLKANLKGQPVKSVGRWSIMQLIVTTGWILLTKAKIQPPNLLPWPVHPIFNILKTQKPSLQIMVPQITSLHQPTILALRFLIKAKSKFL